MPKRSSKPDINQIAARIVRQTTKKTKNPSAVELGRLGGLKGGKARAKKLSSEQRSAIAKRAAEQRWSKSE